MQTKLCAVVVGGNWTKFFTSRSRAETFEEDVMFAAALFRRPAKRSYVKLLDPDEARSVYRLYPNDIVG